MSLLSALETPTLHLRPYQEHAIEAVQGGFKDYSKQLLVMPTGAGKTITFAGLAQAYQPKRTLILAHREELVMQAVDKICKATGILAEIEKAERKADLDAPVVVGSIQSLMRTARLERWPEDHFGLVVIDEAHHALADSYRKVLARFEKHAKVLGVTATPDRGDKKNLGQYFENVPYEITLLDLIKSDPQYLCDIVIKSIPLRIDLTNVSVVRGDYDELALADALSPYLERIAQALKEKAGFRKILVFLPLIDTSKKFCEILKANGIAAEHVDGYSEDRADILKRFADNKFDVLCNAMLLTEGYDDPSIDCVVVLRPTKSRPLYAQMVGRGTRMSPGKLNLLLIDFLWMHERHNLIRPASLIAKSEEAAKDMTALTEKAPKYGDEPEEMDLFEVEATAKEQRENKLKEELAKQARKQANTMDALEYCLSVHAAELADYQPAMKWEGLALTDGQKKFLTQLRINPETVKCRGHASAIIETVISRRKLNLATPKQVSYLKKLGHPSPETATFKEATAYLDERWGKTATK